MKKQVQFETKEVQIIHEQLQKLEPRRRADGSAAAELTEARKQFLKFTAPLIGAVFVAPTLLWASLSACSNPVLVLLIGLSGALFVAAKAFPRA